jgi:hypothetical protein
MLTALSRELNVTEADLQEAKVLADGMTLTEVKKVSPLLTTDTQSP